jgi:HD-GYP domain-containing protein (c-di-GMP phosphodiesterase class II)
MRTPGGQSNERHQRHQGQSPGAPERGSVVTGPDKSTVSEQLERSTERALAEGRGSQAKLAREILLSLAAALRTARVYDPSNATLRGQLNAVSALFKAWTEFEPELTVEIAGEQAFVGGVRVQAAVGVLAPLKAIGALFEKLGIGGVRVSAAANDEHLDRLIVAAARAGSHDELLNQLGSDPVLRVTPPRLVGGSGEGPSRSDRARARSAFMQAIASVRQVLGQAAGSGRVRSRAVTRAAQRVVDQVMRDDAALVGLTALRDIDEATYVHSVNVCVLAVTLAARLRLARLTLREIAVSALLHDLGKVRLDPSVLRKRGKLDDEDWREVHLHPVRGVTTLASSGLKSVPARAFSTALEHHRSATGHAGYPAIPPRRAGLVTRIIQVADIYEALVGDRPYRERSFTPVEALKIMLGPAATNLDSFLVRTFVRMLGPFPPGSLVRLDDGRLAVVLQVSSGSPDQPVVACQPAGDEPPVVVDLARTEVRATSAVDPGQAGVDPRTWLDRVPA